MKNKLKIAVCAIFVVIFSLLPMSVFAYTDNPSPKLLYDIAKGSGKSIYSGYQLICEDSNNYYFWTVESTNIKCSVSTNSYPCNINMGGGGASVQIKTNVFTYPKSNVYDVSVNEGSNGYYYDWESTKLKNITKILYSNKDITFSKDNQTSVFFQQMNSIPQGTSKRVPLNTTLSSIQLTGILDEVISLLPILLPVLITFIAIRKGIAFCLATLRAS